MKKLIVSLATLSLILASAGTASAKFATKSGQGNLSNTNVKNNAGTTSVTGPKGQVKQGNYDCNNCTTNKPGANR